ncbi:5057_t:CDS:2 [Entrophospora sp. SA101]|nr:5057_t:CDS:2 [Entrophospora sp. SA101]
MIHSSYFKLNEISNITQDFIIYTANILSELDFSQDISNNGTVDYTVSQLSNFFQRRNLTIPAKIVDRWNGFAHGNTPLDKIVCILCGYAIFISMCTWYLSKTRNNYRRTVGRAIREELVIFPIICGILLDLSTLPLFPVATPTSRLEFYFESPVTSTLLHWFIGTAFMYYFAVFVTLCRDTVRRGVLWFIRDPNDPQFHPIKEILERPVLTQLRKICASGIMYSAMIVFGIGSVIYFLRHCIRGILPLHWSFSEPISDFPVDLLIFHIIVPVTIGWAKPKRLFISLFEKWWRFTSHQLRLTSFMFGGRHDSEEGTIVRKTWRAIFFNLSPKIPPPGVVEIEDNSNDDVEFVRDGGFVRAPNYDGVPVVPGKRMLVPVTEDGVLLDSNDALVGEDDLLHYMVVYVPPNFKARIILFLFLMWLCGSLFGCSVTVLPLLVGRFIFKNIFRYEKAVHDLYTITIGLYIIWFTGVFMEILFRKVRLFFVDRDNKINWVLVKEKISDTLISAFKVLYIVLSFGFIIPFLLSFIIDLYMILPWKKITTNSQTISFLQDWALGIVYMKIIYRIIFMLPDNDYSRAINVLTAQGLRNMDLELVTSVFIAPISLIGLGAIILPGSAALFYIEIYEIANPNTVTMLYRYVYPLFLSFVFGYYAQQHIVQLIKKWVETVKDEEFLIGRVLQNYEEQQEQEKNAVVSQVI